MLIRFAPADCSISLLSTTSYFGEQHQGVKQSLCALMSRVWYVRVRVSTGFDLEQTVFDQNRSVHRELNVRKYLHNFACIASFIVKAFAAEQVIPIQKMLTRARRREREFRERRGRVKVLFVSLKKRGFGVANRSR